MIPFTLRRCGEKLSILPMSTLGIHLADSNFWVEVSCKGIAMVLRYRHDSVNILARIGEVKTNWPVAELYFGSSPAFRKVHTRLADASEVYALTPNSVDFPTRLNNWLDKSLGTAPDIKAITGSDFALGKER